MKRVPYKKYILKTLSYRFLGSLVTAVATLGISGQVKLSLFVGMSDLLVKPALYYFHELAWHRSLTKKETKTENENEHGT